MAIPTNTISLVVQATGEVRKIFTVRPNGTYQDFADADPDHYVVAIDAALPDGDQVRDLSGEQAGPLHQPGLAKILVGGVTQPQPSGPAHVVGGTIRNATVPELAAFAPGFEAVEEAQDRAMTERMLLNGKGPMGRLFRAMANELEAVESRGNPQGRPPKHAKDRLIDRIQAGD